MARWHESGWLGQGLARILQSTSKNNWIHEIAVIPSPARKAGAFWFHFNISNFSKTNSKKACFALILYVPLHQKSDLKCGSQWPDVVHWVSLIPWKTFSSMAKIIYEVWHTKVRRICDRHRMSKSDRGTGIYQMHRCGIGVWQVENGTKKPSAKPGNEAILRKKYNV